MMSKTERSKLLSRSMVAAAVAAMLATSALAAENRGQRYSPGVGGSDMTSPLVPGWYGQVALLHYHASKLKNNAGDEVGPATTGVVPAAMTGGLGPIAYTGKITKFRADGYVALPRITYLSTKQFLGANIGFTAMLPIMERQTALTGGASLSLTPAQAGAVAASPAAAAGVAAINTSVNAQVNQALSERFNGSNAGIGDLELSPLMRWEIGDNQSVAFAPTIVLPTGEYDKDEAVNTGYGNFYTFRPSVQYAFIGDGWDFGARAVFSFNTRNKDTDYKSGNMLNIDFQVMKFITEDLRLGVQGYVVQQLTKDSSDDPVRQAEIDAAGGNKMRAYALGPALAWIKDGGEMMLEGKVLQEFGARNRAEGTSFWLMLSKPFGL